MKHLMVKTALAVSLACSCGIALAEALAATVNGVEITADDIQTMSAQVYEQKGINLHPGEVTDQFIARELLSQEATRQGGDRALGKTKLAANFFKAYMNQHPLGDEDFRKEYENLKAQDTSEKKREYKVRAIIVATEQEANKIIEGLKKGEPFSSYVGKSIDKKSKNNGGEMGWLELENTDTAMALTIADLKPGAYSESPTHSHFGYSVLLLDDIRTIVFPEYSEVQEALQQKMVKERYDNLINPLIEKANIVRFTGFEKRKVLNLNDLAK